MINNNQQWIIHVRLLRTLGTARVIQGRERSRAQPVRTTKTRAFQSVAAMEERCTRPEHLLLPCTPWAYRPDLMKTLENRDRSLATALVHHPPHCTQQPSLMLKLSYFLIPEIGLVVRARAQSNGFGAPLGAAAASGQVTSCPIIECFMT